MGNVNGLTLLVEKMPQLVRAVVKYREALKKEGLPADDVNYQVTMFQTSLMNTIMRGEDDRGRYLDLGGGGPG